MKLVILLVAFAIIAIVRWVVSQRQESTPPPLPRPQPSPEDNEELVLDVASPMRHWFRDGIGQFKFGSYGGCLVVTRRRLLFVSTGTDGIYESSFDARGLAGLPVAALFSVGGPMSLGRTGSFAIPLDALDTIDVTKNRLRMTFRRNVGPMSLVVMREQLIGNDALRTFAESVRQAKAADTTANAAADARP